MFKGLKSKLEDEAKRLQQYGENIANQVRSSASETGSDISGRGRKLFENALGAVQQQSQQQNSKTGATMANEDPIISLNDEVGSSDKLNRSASAASDETIPTRQRHFSDASMESNESSFNPINLPAHVQQSSSLLETISSDVESNAGSITDLGSLESTISNDKFTSIFQRLQGKATDYKQKYRELIKTYRELDRENEKLRSVFSSTQDKALKRISKLKEEKSALQSRINVLEKQQEEKQTENPKIKKLQDLLVKCKEEITTNRERITSLMEENSKLKAVENNSTEVEKISAEWKGRFDRQEEEWIKRMAECEEKAAIKIATSKAEMHSTLQQKDLELENWIGKCHGLEKQDEDANTRWQEKVDGLQKAIYALEQEKADMVQKLSQAKQEGVKLVKEAEERRYGDILTTELKKKDEEWGRRVKELEEQMQLAVEENDLQRKTTLADYERISGKLKERVDELEKENAKNLLELRKYEEELRTKEEKIQKLGTEQTESDNIRDSLAELDAKLTDEKKRSSGYEKKIRTLEEVIEEIMKKNGKLEQINTEQEEKIRTLEKEKMSNEAEKLQIEEIMQKNGKLEQINLEQEKKIQKLEEEKQQIEEGKTQMDKIMENNGNSEQTNLEKDKKIKTLEEQMDEIMKKNDKMEQINLEQEKKIQKLEEEKLTNEVEKSQIGEIMQKNGKFEQINLEQEKKIRTMEEEKKQIQEFLEKKKKLEQINLEQEKKIRTLEEEKAQMEEEKSKTKEIIERNRKLEQTNLEQEKEIRLLEEEKQQKMEEIMQKNDKNLEQEKKIRTMEEEKAQIDEILQKNKKLEELNLGQEKKIQIYEKEKQQMETEKAKMGEIIEKNEKLEQINLEQEKKIRILEEEKQNIEKKRQQKMEEITQKNGKLELEKEKKIRTLEEEKQKMEEEKQQISLELKKTNQELKKLKEIETRLKVKTEEFEEFKLAYNELEKLKDESIKREEELNKKLEGNEQKQQKKIEEIRKEAEKAKQKAISGFQSEIRQLYNSINEKDCELAANHANISKLENELSTLRSASAEVNQKKGPMDKQQSKQEMYSSFGETIDLDELLELKKKLADQEEELNRLKSMHESNGVQKPKRPQLTPKMSITSDHLNFAEPTEAEYLRNVIYRYMTEREDLGRESVTLAKVICTVCKFPPEQLNNVLRREEARCQGWLPASVAEKATIAARRIHRQYANSSAGHNRLDYDKM